MREQQQDLQSVARMLVAGSKGILAADESGGTIGKRFERVHVESTEQTRRAYRDLLLTAPGIEQYISGVILFDETIHQSAHDGTPFPQLLLKKGILPGIKVDKGAVDLPGFPGEKVTEGLDGLRGRLAEYRRLGAKFAKWRAVIAIGANFPTRTGLEANAYALAQYAALCQEAGLVPIVEPEVLMDGDHTLERCEAVTEQALRLVFFRLEEHRVQLDGMLLKPNMVVPGKQSARQAGVLQVAQATIRCLRRTVPAAVPGIVFLSGGQSPELASEHLNAMQALGPHPWAVGFSYARALQEPALQAWKGNPANVGEAQRLFIERARLNSLAREGRYSEEMEKKAA
ncbi:MAG TPA: class I fructose-bisphosphate aldolase [Candidatus Sulfotelmatobacter sp.]|nr:class I fructose-bisphosphate aldolase [Candidatus Sulfotelmatobacter sp.]